MRIPEPLFKIINRIVGAVLRSPVHGFWSDSLLVIEFQGRKSGRSYKTPVRYVEVGDAIQCFTAKSGKWWRNVAAAGQVRLLVQGVEADYQPQVTIDDPTRVAVALRQCLALFPQDAAYHDISVGPDGAPNEADFEQALPDVVLIELTPVRHNATGERP